MPIGLQELEASRIYRQSAYEGSRVVSRIHRPSLPPRRYSQYSFLLEAESTPLPYYVLNDRVIKKSQWPHQEKNQQPSILERPWITHQLHFVFKGAELRLSFVIPVPNASGQCTRCEISCIVGLTYAWTSTENNDPTTAGEDRAAQNQWFGPGMNSLQWDVRIAAHNFSFAISFKLDHSLCAQRC